MGQLLVGVLLLIVSSLIFIETGNLGMVSDGELGPGAFPRLISLIMGGLSLYLVIYQTIKIIKQQSLQKIFSYNWKSVINQYQYSLLILINFILYVVLFDILGFQISTFLFVSITIWQLGPKAKKEIPRILIISAALGFAMFYLFQEILGVRFPSGIL